jgi:transcriptional regulator with XRE-family HTH domain
MTYGQIIRQERITRGLTLKELATACGTHKGYVCMIEKGNCRPPTPRFTVKFCRHLGLDPEFMICLAYAEKAPQLIRKQFVEFVNTKFVVAPAAAREEMDNQNLRKDRPRLVIG